MSFALLPLVSSAEELNVGTDSSIKVQAAGVNAEIRAKAQADFEARKMELEQKREDLKMEMEKRREELKTQMEERKDEMEQKRETVKDQVEAQREEIRNQMEERREGAIGVIKERLSKFTENLVKRFDAAIERLEVLADRIDSRISKMEAENLDVTDAKELMVVARIKLETAKTSAAGIDLESVLVASSTATTTATIKADFDSLRTQIEKAKSDIKAAHAALVDVIKNLKPGQRKQPTATSTATTTDSN